MAEPQACLVVDDDKGALGEVALRLIRLGLDVFYAKDRGEGWLLAQQEAEAIAMLLIAPGVDPDGVDAILGCLQACTPGRAPGILAIGARPDAADRERLREVGVEQALWEPFDESALRMAVAAAMAPAPTDGETRRSSRLPTTLLGRAFLGIRRKDCVVYSLSLHGAFLETAYPYEEGTKLTLEIELPGAPLVARANVVHSREKDDPSGPGPVGMGVAFAELPDAARQRLADFLREIEERFAV